MRRKFEKSAFIFIENQRLLVTRSQGNEIYFLPGGAKNETESHEEALIREIKEELDVEVEPNSLKFLFSSKSPTFEDPENSDVILNCFTGHFRGSLKPSNEVEQLDWFTYEDRNRVSLADQVVFDYLKENFLIK